MITKPLYHRQTLNSLILVRKPYRAVNLTVYIAFLEDNDEKDIRALEMILVYVCLPFI